MMPSEVLEPRNGVEVSALVCPFRPFKVSLLLAGFAFTSQSDGPDQIDLCVAQSV